MLKQAVRALENDEIICFPTETLYALSCNPFSESALRRLYNLKQRQHGKPCPLLFSSLEEIRRFSNVDEIDLMTMRMLLDGQITFIMPLPTIHMLPSGFFKNTLGARVSSHKTALSILHAFGYPLVATSANISGIPGGTKASDVPEAIKKGVSVFIEDDTSVTGTCSTVFDVKSRTILREGSFSDTKIFDIISTVTR